MTGQTGDPWLWSHSSDPDTRGEQLNGQNCNVNNLVRVFISSLTWAWCLRPVQLVPAETEEEGAAEEVEREGREELLLTRGEQGEGGAQDGADCGGRAV